MMVSENDNDGSLAEDIDQTERESVRNMEPTDDTIRNSEEDGCLESTESKSHPCRDMANDGITTKNETGEVEYGFTDPILSTGSPTRRVLEQAHPRNGRDPSSSDNNSGLVGYSLDGIDGGSTVSSTTGTGTLPGARPVPTIDPALLSASLAPTNVAELDTTRSSDGMRQDDHVVMAKSQTCLPTKRRQPPTKKKPSNVSPLQDRERTSCRNESVVSPEASTVGNSHEYREKRRQARAWRLKEHNISIDPLESSKVTAVHMTPNTSNESRRSTSSEASLESSSGTSQSVENDEVTYPSRNSSLVVAFVVGQQGDDNDDNDDTQQETLVHAVRFDPNTITSSRHNRSLRAYAIILAVLFLVLIVILSRAFKDPPSTSNESVTATAAPTSAPTLLGASTTSARSTEYRNFFAQFVGDNVHDPSSPLYTAADWIINQDKLQRGLEHPDLLQRYLMAFLYFHTTNNGNRTWKSCNPPLLGEDEFCEFFQLTDQYEESIVLSPTIVTRWLSSQEECYWAGISCEGTSVITSLMLGAQELTGSLPTELALLSNLNLISLPYNELTGTIPTDYGINLVELNVMGNLLTGSIPVEFFETGARMLQNWNVGDNLLSGGLDSRIGLMTNLEVFYLFKNSFSGSFPTQVGNLLSLSHIRANGNQFTGYLPTELGSMEQLIEFWFHDNHFNGTISSEFGLLSQVQDFRLGGNWITGTIPDEIFNMSQLQALHLRETQLKGTLSSLVGQLTQLQVLILSSNQLTGTIPSAMQNMSNLQIAWLHDNMFTGPVPTEICSLVGPMGLEALQTDCFPSDNPPNPCACCSTCCDRDEQVCVKVNDTST